MLGLKTPPPGTFVPGGQGSGHEFLTGMSIGRECEKRKGVTALALCQTHKAVLQSLVCLEDASELGSDR